MRKTSTLLALIIISALIVGSIRMQPLAELDAEGLTGIGFSSKPMIRAGFDSENISIALLNIANQSTVSGTFNMTVNVTSVNGPLNLTLFIEGEIYADYNQTLIGAGSHNVTVNTTILSEGYLNFTMLFENETFTPPDRESYTLVFNVDNHGPPALELIGPEANSTLTGLSDLLVNISSDYSQVYANITVNDEITQEYNQTLVSVGLTNLTINCSRYENGISDIGITIYTEEGFEVSTVRSYYFLDYVFFFVRGLAHYDAIIGNAEIEVIVETPFENVTLSVLVDGILAPDVANITVPAGRSAFYLNTTGYSEGEHNFTFKAYDYSGHKYETTLTLVVDNHGVPIVEFIGSEQMAVGLAEFTVNITTTWDTVSMTVYVDGNEVAGLVNITVIVGQNTFLIDVGNYTKFEHDVKVVITTEEGENGEVEKKFGFASVRIEEIGSLLLLLGIAVFIPLLRRKNGQPIKPILIVDLIFIIVIAVVFLALGVTTYPLMVWHFNLSSIWAVGIALIFANWAIPFVMSESD
ncbi:MAG: hypothetical protein KAU89_09680 [Candidatus Thorarchaeota archaeon]|nr:hypothetical protein [Candidatus Thorarchaeota archaeon]